MFKSKTALIFAAAGLVLTFVFTVGKLIDPGVLFFRYLVNIVLFYGIGLGVFFLVQRFLVPVLKQQEEQTSDLSNILSGSRTEAPGKGGRLDLTVDGPADPTSSSGMAGAGSDPAGAGGAEGEAGGADGKAAPNPLGPHTDFEIRDDFIIINDKKVPNDPKLMASAIKTKLEDG